ncbi:MAG: hypothetical protein B7Y00_05635, partial [Sphingomonadales bacterium 17-56-6]
MGKRWIGDRLTVQIFTAIAVALLVASPVNSSPQMDYETIEAAAADVPPKRSLTVEEEGQAAVWLISAVSAMNKGEMAASAAQFARLLAFEERVLGAEHPGILKTLQLAGLMETLRGRPQSAEAHLGRAFAIASRYLEPQAPELLELLHYWAASLHDAGRPIDAEQLFVRALEGRLAALGITNPQTLETLEARASNLADLGRDDEAEPLLEQGYEAAVFALGENHLVSLKLLNARATNLSRLGRSAEADPLFARAVGLRTKLNGTDDLGTYAAISNHAANLFALGRWLEAEPLFAQVLGISRDKRGAMGRETLSAALNYGTTLQVLNRLGEAEKLLEPTSQALAELLGPTHDTTAMAYYNLAVTRMMMKHGANVLAPARAGASAARLQRTQIGSAVGGDAQYIRQARRDLPYFTMLADADWAALQAGKGDIASLRNEAFGALQEAMIGTTSQALAFAAARTAVDRRGNGIAELVRERQLLSDQWGATDRLLTASFTDDKPSAPVARSNLRAQLVEIERRIIEIDAQLAVRSPGYYALTRPSALSIAQSQQLLETGEAAVLIVPAMFGTHVITLTRDAVDWHSSDLDKSEIEKLVERLRRDLDADDGSNTRSFDRKTAYKLYVSLIAPATATLTGVKRVYIAANGALAALPFGVLVSAPPSGDDADPVALRATQWFADAHALVQVPSLQALA